MLVVAGLAAGGLGEVEPADDAYALGDLALHPGLLAVATGLHPLAVKTLVGAADKGAVGQALLDGIMLTCSATILTATGAAAGRKLPPDGPLLG